MKKILVLLLIILSLLIGQAVLAQADNANVNANVETADQKVDISIYPDSPLYWLKILAEKIQETFTLRTEAKMQLMEKLGEKRAAEAQKMIEKGKTELAQKIMDKYNERLTKMEALIEKKGEKLDAKLEAIQNRVKTRFEHRNEVLQRVTDKASAQAKPGLQRALDNSNDRLLKVQARIKTKIEKRDQLNQRLKDRLNNFNTTN